MIGIIYYFGRKSRCTLPQKRDGYISQALREKQFVATGLFLGEAGIGAAPTVTSSGSSAAAAPTNSVVGVAGNMSRPYTCVDL